MNARTIVTTAAALGVAAALLPVAAGAATPGSGSLLIHHQKQGCHAWSLNGGSYRAALDVALKRGGTLTITDNDLMPHRLVKLSGPSVVERLVTPGSMSMGKLTAPYAAGMMPHMGATLRVSFPTKGVYTFRTKAGDDYMAGIKTTGPDNVLRLTVVVS